MGKRAIKNIFILLEEDLNNWYEKLTDENYGDPD